MTLFDGLQEMFDFLSRHKLRTVLTALSVAWGVFMLVVLLAAGRGLQNGVEHEFRDDATNSIWVRPAKTSLSYRGTVPGRSVRLTNADLSAVQREVSGVEHITGRFYLWGETPISYGSQTAHFEVRGCHPDHLYLEKTLMVAGRFINEIDLERRRKVAVIGPEVHRELFQQELGDEPAIGKYIKIHGVEYQVVGSYVDEGNLAELKKIYIPITTAQLVYNGADRMHHLMFTIGSASVEESEAIATRTREVVARRQRFSPEDRRALSITNNLVRFQKLREIFDWLAMFVWIVGIGTLLAGMVGVSNVMLISVKERTLEIGIRKAIGATPASIVRMVLQEALFITSTAGYLGLVAGAGLIELVRRHLPENQYVRNPEVDFRIAVAATLVLILVGVLAGLLPALNAAQVKPVVAMRGE